MCLSGSRSGRVWSMVPRSCDVMSLGIGMSDVDGLYGYIMSLMALA